MGRTTYVRFKGSPSEYRSLHLWVERRLGKPMECSKCHDIGRKRYEWANVSGEYHKDESDWIRLCKPCHVKMDGWPVAGVGGGTGNTTSGSERYNWMGDYCTKGHPMSGDNILMKRRRSRYVRICRACQRGYWEAYCLRKREEVKT